MIAAGGETPDASGRLIVAGDVDRLAPLVERFCSPIPVTRCSDCLHAIAELPLAETCGVIIWIDPESRRHEEAIRALRQVSGSTRIVLCCEPADEPLSRSLLVHGADDYVISPVERDELTRALQLPMPASNAGATGDSLAAGDPAGDELVMLSELMKTLAADCAEAPNEMAALVAAALHAQSASVVVDGSRGVFGPHPDEHGPALVQDIINGRRCVGQIRLGPSANGAYDARDIRKLRIYSTLFSRFLAAASITQDWQRLALHDDLTGLPNRRHLLRFLGELLPKAEQENMPVTVLIFDIDNFKTYNDRFGHDAGDALIRETGALFVRGCRKHDFVCRYGGDEFVVVFWDAEGPRAEGSQHPLEVIGVLNRFRKDLSTHTFSTVGPNSQGCLTCSGGLAQFPAEAKTTEALISRADEALLEAKRAGKNRFWLVGSGDVCANSNQAP